MKQTVFLGLSGGVDSSVSACLLKKAGYDVHAVFMKNWEEDDTDTYCAATQDIADSTQICEQLAIPLEIINFSDQYWEQVFSHFLKEYQAGRTPNPDILCNREIKFKAFLDYALAQGAEYIATGHYAQNGHNPTQTRQDSVSSLSTLLKAHDQNKDQTYFLYAISQKALAHTLFPIGHLEKSTVRQLATQYRLPNHQKKDSTGICFIGERRFKTFLDRYLPAQPGEIIDDTGHHRGTHDGLMFYTIGQRQGLHIGGTTLSNGQPWYVIDKDLDSNRLIVGQGFEHPLLYKQTLQASQLAWIQGQAPAPSFQATAKIRYRQAEQACHVSLDDSLATVEFETPQRAVTPGQSIVFYQGSVCLGGGIIL